MNPHHCPTCGARTFERTVTPGGPAWKCASCKSLVLNLDSLRRRGDPDSINLLWNAVRSETARTGPPCPSCNKPMAVFSVEDAGALKDADVCPKCRLFFVKPDTTEAFLRTAGLATAQSDAEHDLRRDAALAEVEFVSAQANSRLHDNPMPDSWWKMILAGIGIPVEIEEEDITRVPWITFGLAALIVLTALFTFSDVPMHAAVWGFLPSDPWRNGGLTFFTPVFLHIGWWHLLTNLYFLLVFGKNVEDKLGYWKYALLITCASIGCCAAEALFSANRNVPIIGASGVISGIALFYAFQFPLKRFGFFFLFLFRAGWIVLPAIVFVFIWVVIQFLGVMVEVSGPSGAGVAYLGHLGGAVVGVAFWLVDRFLLHPGANDE